MLRKILVANRGEIAVRIARACRELGIKAAMVYSDADRTALHVRSGDEAYYAGPSPASESYLRGDNLISLALHAGCDAVHPGYGFLAENAAFARAVSEAGLVWIGPPPGAITLMGSKIESKRLAQEKGVPLVPGYFGDDQSLDTLVREARQIGYPLLVKASAGGGGKGMRVVAEEAILPESIEGARREASAAFGDDGIMLEKYLTSPRHIEVQVMGDLHGNVVDLGERDCTIQRRHQKVVEESPSPVLDDKLREQITAAAVRLAKAVGYTSAGTVEFIFEAGAFYFLEMNTRIQVEHPVTEEALGVDLVQAQIRIAAGEPLENVLDGRRPGRHSIEARLYAEDPATGFLPSVGQLTTFTIPLSDDTLRIDSGVEQGDVVTPYYDPLLAKIIASGEDRFAALLRLRNALRAVEVEGPRTNLAFLRWLLAHPDFADGNFSTHFIDENYGTSSIPEVPVGVPLAAAFVLTSGIGSPGQVRDVWDTYAWRQARQRIPLRFMVAGYPYRVCLSAQPGGGANWTYEIESSAAPVQKGLCKLQILSSSQDDPVKVAIELEGSEGSTILGVQCQTGGNQKFLVFHHDDVFPVRIAEPLSTERLEKKIAVTDDDTLASPMPGKVLKVLIERGEDVVEDQPLVIIEAMKMEFTVRAPHAGRIAEIKYAPGTQVAVGDILVEMEKGS